MYYEKVKSTYCNKLKELFPKCIVIGNEMHLEFIEGSIFCRRLIEGIGDSPGQLSTAHIDALCYNLHWLHTRVVIF